MASTISISTYLSPARAAELGISSYGVEAVTPTAEQWAALPAHLRVFLAKEFLADDKRASLHVEARGWEGVVAAAVIDYERRVARAIEHTSTFLVGLEVVANDPRVIKALEEEEIKQRQAARQREAELIAELTNLNPLECYLRTYRRGDTPGLVKEWLEKRWDEIVDAAARRTIGRDVPEITRIDELRVALKNHPLVLEAEAKAAANAAAKAAAKAAGEAQEQADLAAWAAKAAASSETVRYAVDHGYGVLELLVEAVDEALEGYDVIRLREGTTTYDQSSWETRKNPRSDALALAREVTTKLATIGLPVTPGQQAEGVHLHLFGVARFEDDDGIKSTRVVVRLVLPSSGEVVWAVCRDERQAE